MTQWTERTVSATTHEADRRTVSTVTIQKTGDEDLAYWWLELQIGNGRALFTQTQALELALALESFLPPRAQWASRLALKRQRRNK